MSDAVPRTLSESKTGSILWRQRLLWATIGALIAILAGWAYAKVAEHGANLSSAPPTDTAQEPALFPPSPTNSESSVMEDCFIGVVVARDSASVASENAGLLQSVTVRVGDSVEKGQILASLDTSDLRHQLTIDQATLASARARLSQSELEAGRAGEENARRLEMTDLLSKEELASSRFALETANAQLQAAKSEVERAEARIGRLQTTLSRSEIRAPFSGTVAQRYLDPGSRVNTGTSILRLISSGGLLTRFAVPAERAETLAIGTAVRVELADLDQALAGTIRHRAPEIDAAAQMVFIEADLDSAAEAITVPSGAAARVAILSATETPPSCLPGPQIRIKTEP